LCHFPDTIKRQHYGHYNIAASVMKGQDGSSSSDVSPLDNASDVGLEASHERFATESTLLNQFLNGVGPTSSSSYDHSDVSTRNPSSSRSSQRINPWREVNGEWLHQQNHSHHNQQFNHLENQWHDSDHMDVPLLISPMEDSTFGREIDAWDHCHQRSSDSFKSQKARNQLISASILCLIFMIAEAVGGYFSNSLAVMTDAAHMLSDFTSFLVSIFALWVSSRPPSKNMSFGYYRAEILGAVLSVLIIWILTGILMYVAVDRLIHPDYDIDADTMIIIAGIGVAMNIAMGVILHGGLCDKLDSVHHGHTHGGGGRNHGHSHGHSHNERGHGHSHLHDNGNHQHQLTDSSRNVNVRAALIHVIGDLVQSIGVLIAAFVIKYWPECRMADPICTFLFSGLVLATTIGLIRDASHVLMEGVPRNIEYDQVRLDLKSIEGVHTVHDLNIWSLTLDRNAITAHLTVSSTTDCEKVVKSATRILQNKYGIKHSTVQVERYNSSIMEICPRCTSLGD